MLVFGSLMLLMPFLGSSWRLLAHSDPKMVPKMYPELDQQSETNGPKIDSIVDAAFNKFWACFGGKFDDQNGQGNSNIPSSRIQDAHKTALKTETVVKI